MTMQFYEVLKIKSGNSTLELCLTGKGVTPVIKLRPDNTNIDLGYVVQGEEITSTFSVNLGNLLIALLTLPFSFLQGIIILTDFFFVTPIAFKDLEIL